MGLVAVEGRVTSLRPVLSSAGPQPPPFCDVPTVPSSLLPVTEGPPAAPQSQFRPSDSQTETTRSTTLRRHSVSSRSETHLKVRQGYHTAHATPPHLLTRVNTAVMCCTPSESIDERRNGGSASLLLTRQSFFLLHFCPPPDSVSRPRSRLLSHWVCSWWLGGEVATVEDKAVRRTRT